MYVIALPAIQQDNYTELPLFFADTHKASSNYWEILKEYATSIVKDMIRL